MAAADRDVRARVGEALRDAAPDAAAAAGDEHDVLVEAWQLGRVGHGGGVYDLTPARRLPRCRASPFDHEEHRVPVPDKRVTIDDIVGEVQRRHDRRDRRLGIASQADGPGARARAGRRCKDLTIVSYGGPDVGLLCRAGKVREVVYAFVSLDSIALEPHFRNARQSGAVATTELDEGMFLLGLQAAAWRVPFLPTRVGLGSDVMRLNPDAARPCGRRTPTARSSSRCPRSTLDVALIHMHRGDQGGTGQYLNVDPYFDDLVLHGGAAAVHVGRAASSTPRSS